MTTPATIRAQAARLVVRVNAGKSLNEALSRGEHSAQERGLLWTLVYGTIRWQIRLEAALDNLLSRPQRELDPELRGLMLVGLFQLLHTDIAPHAVVAETVEAARVLKQPRAAGLVNAVLRRCQREATSISAQLDTDLAVRTAHPSWLVDMLARDWPDRYREILDANNAHPPMWLRVNRTHSTTEAYLNRLNDVGIAAERSAIAPEALLLQSPIEVRSLPGFSAGDVSVQDAAAQIAAHLLAPEPGDRVLDACAAPGGKTCHLLELEPKISELIAVDVSAERLRRVEENIERLGLRATVVVGDATRPQEWWDGRPFNRILLDVPCSATGVIRRHPDIKLLRRPGDIAELAHRQSEILLSSWKLLAPGGRLLYSSCSALKIETSAVVAAFLADNPDAHDVTDSACQILGLRAEAAPGLAIAAGQDQMDGFYYACLTKRA